VQRGFYLLCTLFVRNYIYNLYKSQWQQLLVKITFTHFVLLDVSFRITCSSAVFLHLPAVKFNVSCLLYVITELCVANTRMFVYNNERGTGSDFEPAS